MRRSIVRRLPPVLVAAAAWVAMPAINVIASCHIATLEENERTVAESAPHVELWVELDGQGSGLISCTGTIRWETKDRTAKAGGDYQHSKGELSWKTGDLEWRKPIRIPILEDRKSEAAETFSVTLTAAPGSGINPEQSDGSGAGGPTAVVTITDNDKATSSPPAGTSSTSQPGPPQPGASLSASPGATASTNASAQPTAPAKNGSQARGSIDETPIAAPAAQKDGGNKSMAAVVGLLLALGAGTGYLLWRRRA